MTITLNEIIPLLNLISSLKNDKMPIKLAFKLNNLAILIEQHQQFYIDQINKILEDYGKKDKDGNLMLAINGEGYQIQDDKIEECNKEIKELESLEVQIPPDITFTLVELEDISLTLQEMSALNKLIVLE